MISSRPLGRSMESDTTHPAAGAALDIKNGRCAEILRDRNVRIEIPPVAAATRSPCGPR